MSIEVKMVYNSMSGLYAQKRCCTVAWVDQSHATVCTSQACLEGILNALTPKVSDLIEVHTYRLVEE